MGKKKQPKPSGLSPFEDIKVEPVEVATHRDPQTGLLFAKDAQGQVFKVTEEEFAQGGFIPVVQEDVDAVRRAEEQQTSAIGAGALGVARGALGPIMDLPLAEIPGYGEMVQRNEEEHPWASGVGEAAGMVAPLLLTGGLGTAARAGTLPGALEAAGGLAERGVASALGGRGVLSGAARWGVEGAGYGLAGELSDQAIKGGPTDWAKVASATGGGAFYAGLLGGGFGGLGRFAGARQAAKEGASKLTPKGSVDEILALEGLPDEVKDAVYKLSATDKMFEVGQPGKGSARILAAIRNDPKLSRYVLRDEQEKILQRYSDVMTEGLEAGADINQWMYQVASGRPKLEWWKQNLTEVDADTLRKSLVQKYSQLAAELEQTAARTPMTERSNFTHNLIETLKQKVGTPGVAVGDLYKMKTAAEMAMDADVLKRAIQSNMRKKKGIVQSWDDVAEILQRESDPRMVGGAASEAKGQMPGLATLLERPDIVGSRASAMQKEVNALWHRQMNHEGFFNSLKSEMADMGPNNIYRRAERTDPAKVRAFLDGLAGPNKAYERGILKQFAKETEEFVGTARKYYEMDAPTMARMDSIVANARKLDAVMEPAIKDVELIHKLRSFEQADPHTWARIFGAMAGGALGAVGFGPVGGIAGLAAGAHLGQMLNPYGKIQTAAALRRALNAEDGWKAHLIDLLSGTKWAGKSGAVDHVPQLVQEAKRPTGRKMKAATRALLYNAFREDGDDDVKAYERQMQHVAQASKDPARVREGIKAMLGEAADEYPQAVEYLTNQTIRGSEALLAYAPRASEPKNVLFGNWFRTPPSKEQLASFEDIFTAVLSPKAVLENAAALDDITPEQVRVLDYVHPDLMEDFRVDLQMALAQRDKAPSEERLRTLSIIFKVPLTPSMEPGYMDAMQEIHETRNELEAKQTPKPRNQPYRNRRNLGETGVNTGTRSSQIEETLNDPAD